MFLPHHRGRLYRFVAKSGKKLGLFETDDERDRTTLVSSFLDKSADGYAERADNMLDGLGLNADKMYEDWGFAETSEVPRRMEFWYRRSPQRLVPVLDSRQVRDARVVAINNRRRWFRGWLRYD